VENSHCLKSVFLTQIEDQGITDFTSGIVR
jgi:hypothetical protein